MSSKLVWESIEPESSYNHNGNNHGSYTLRAKVHKGWLVKTGVYSREQLNVTADSANGPDYELALGVTNSVGITFVPDENFEWVL
jgi:hypothetical protein